MNESIENPATDALESVECVISEPIKFKLKLGIGDDAFTSLKLKKTLETMWGVKTGAAFGASAASSSAVAGTLFAGSGGFLSAIGFGAAAATPVGWVMGAAVVSGGAFYGVMSLFDRYTYSRVSSVPKFINSPIDLLGANLFDMMASLALKVSDFGDGIDQAERIAIKDYCFEEWGFSQEYLDAALPIVETTIKDVNLKDLAKKIAEYQLDNPDCNPTAMRKDLKLFLEEIACADGQIDEREEIALEIVDQTFDQVLSSSNQLKRSTGSYVDAASSFIKGLTKSTKK